MKSVRFLPLPSLSERVSSPTVVELLPPIAPTLPRPRVEPPPTRTRNAVPQSVPPLTMPVAPTVVPSTIVAAPIAPPATPRDSSSTGIRASRDDIARRSLADAIATRNIPVFPPAPANTNRAGAAMAPAGVTAHNAPLSVAARDSIATMKMAILTRLAQESLRRPLTDAEKRELRNNQEPGRALPNSRAAPGGLVAPLMNGQVAVATPVPMISIPLPLFTRSPSPVEPLEDRMLRMRLQDRLALKRDSVRVDSLRRDSLDKARIRP